MSEPLLTDLYQLTMVCAYWKSGADAKEAVFELVFRQNPFEGGYTVACGLADAIDAVRNFRFSEDDLAYLGSIPGSDGTPLFEPAFLDYLRGFKLRCDIDAVPEGTVVFPREPLVRVQGPIAHCQILETALLNIINFQTLIATKAARVCSAAHETPVVEFGLRRAQGPDGGLSATRGAFIGGCAATSNVLAGKRFGIPVRGTHAHSWVMAFDTEEEAFQAYACAMPNHCVLLVDTFDSIEGVRRAIETGKWLRRNGHELAGIRLDSGDLAALSIEARRILDEAGFQNAVITGTNDLDEHRIADLNGRGAKIGSWGVGTRLSTGFDQPALSGVYKLTAVRRPGEKWDYKLKLSEQETKASDPGIHQVRRYRVAGQFAGDMIFDLELGMTGEPEIVDPAEPGRHTIFADDAVSEDLLVPIFRGGELVYDVPSISDSQARTKRQLDGLPARVKRLEGAEIYPVGLEPRLETLREEMVQKLKTVVEGDAPASPSNPE